MGRRCSRGAANASSRRRSGGAAGESSRRRSGGAAGAGGAAAHRWLRFGVQVVFLILAPGVWNSAWGGVKYVFSQIGGLSAVEPVSFVVTLLALLGFTVVFGRFFCGFACAFGMLGDIVWGAVDFVLGRLHLPHPRIPERVMSRLAWVKYAVLACICTMCLLGVWDEVSGASPWAAFASLTTLSPGSVSPVSFAVLLAVAVGMAFEERFFCRVLCPLGAVFSLVPTLPVTAFTRNRDHCARKCGRCHAACPVGIWPDADTLAHGECIACGRCADACPMRNVNFVAIEKRGHAVGEARGGGDAGAAGRWGRGRAAGAASVIGEEMLSTSETRPRRKTREGWWLICGSSAASVLVRAALLFALVWVLGSVRYLPTIAWGV